MNYNFIFYQLQFRVLPSITPTGASKAPHPTIYQYCFCLSLRASAWQSIISNSSLKNRRKQSPSPTIYQYCFCCVLSGRRGRRPNASNLRNHCTKGNGNNCAKYELTFRKHPQNFNGYILCISLKQVENKNGKVYIAKNIGIYKRGNQ